MILKYLFIKKIHLIFRNRNRRHIYRVENFLFVNNIKTRLAQCFFHKYREKRYKFFVIKIIESCFAKQSHEHLMNFVLNLLTYILISTQLIYFLSTFFYETIYLIEALNERD